MEADSLNILRDSLAMFRDSLAQTTASAVAEASGGGGIWTYVSAGLDAIYKLGMVVIAAVNIYFARSLRKQQEEKEAAKTSSDHKVALLKTLILDSNLNQFYEFFTNLQKETDKLKSETAEIKNIEKDIQKRFKELNEGFIDLLQGIDENLYNNVLGVSDNTRDAIMLSMSENRLHVEKVYMEHITLPVSKMKKEIIKHLFEFK